MVCLRVLSKQKDYIYVGVSFCWFILEINSHTERRIIHYKSDKVVICKINKVEMGYLCCSELTELLQSLITKQTKTNLMMLVLDAF